MKNSSPYLPPEGKYKPAPLKEASSYGYPWQHNPMVHKTTSDPFLCRSRHVFRRYKDNLVVYTRTADQITNGLYTYYLYDEHASVIETGEVALPLNITDDNWHLYKYKSYDEQSAFIRSLGNRISVMAATYQSARSAADGASLCFHPLKTIRCYPLIKAANPVDAAGSYTIPDSIVQYDFIFNTKDDVDVSISTCQSVTPQLPVVPIVQATLQPVHLVPITAKQPQLATQPAICKSNKHNSAISLSSGISRVAPPFATHTIDTARSYCQAASPHNITMLPISGHRYQCDTLPPPGSLWILISATTLCNAHYPASETEIIPALYSLPYNHKSPQQQTDVQVSTHHFVHYLTANSVTAHSP